MAPNRLIPAVVSLSALASDASLLSDLHAGSDADTQYLWSQYEEGTFQPHTLEEGAIQGSYFISYHDGCDLAGLDESIHRGSRFDKLKIEAVELQTVEEAAKVLRHGCVRRLEQNLNVSIDYDLPPYGLDLIDGKFYDGVYTRGLSGQGVDVYVLDTGIDADHTQLAGRVGEGWSLVGGGTGDGNSHGTHCAGTVAGKDVGVAPGATVIPVKVLSDSGSGSWTGILAGLDKIVEEKERRGSSGRPMVVSSSLGGGYSPTINDGFNAAVDAGIVVTVSAGNNNYEASRKSPASAEKVITVGCIDESEEPAWFTNYGPAVDIFAPGVGTLSAKANSGSELSLKSGTSMSCPHVAGVVALMLEANPTWTVDQVKENLFSECTEDAGSIKTPDTTGLKLRTWAAFGRESQCAASGGQAPIADRTQFV